MQAKDIMSSPIITTKGNVKLTYVKDLFSKNNISSAPVLDDKGVIEGIVSNSDLVANQNKDLTVSSVMSKRIKICALNARVVDIANIMITEHIHHVIAMEDGEVCGMISSLDVIGGLLKNK